MRKLIAAAFAALVACSGARAAEMHVSHFGQVMPSVPWIIALEQDLFRKNGVDITDVISAKGGGSTLRNIQQYEPAALSDENLAKIQAAFDKLAAK